MTQASTPLSIKTCLTESFLSAKKSRLAIWLPILASGLISMFIMLLLDSALPKSELIAGSWRQFAVSMLALIVVMPIQVGISMIAVLKQRQQAFSTQTAFNYYPFFQNLAFIAIIQTAVSFLLFNIFKLILPTNSISMLFASSIGPFIFYFSPLLCVDQKFNFVNSLRVSIQMLLHNNNWTKVLSCLIALNSPKILALMIILHTSFNSAKPLNPGLLLLLIALLPILIYIEPVCIHLQAYTFRNILKQKS